MSRIYLEVEENKHQTNCNEHQTKSMTKKQQNLSDISYKQENVPIKEERKFEKYVANGQLKCLKKRKGVEHFGSTIFL